MKSCMIRNSGNSVVVLCFLILQNYFLQCREVGITQYLGICLWLILAFKCQLHLRGVPGCWGTQDCAAIMCLLLMFTLPDTVSW